MMRLMLAVGIGLMCVAGLCAPDEFSDDFSKYPDGADASEVWYNSSVLWEVQDGKLNFDGPSVFSLSLIHI